MTCDDLLKFNFYIEDDNVSTVCKSIFNNQAEFCLFHNRNRSTIRQVGMYDSLVHIGHNTYRQKTFLERNL